MRVRELALADPVTWEMVVRAGTYSVWLGGTGPAPQGAFVRGVGEPLQATFQVV